MAEAREDSVLDVVQTLYATALGADSWTPSLDAMNGLFDAVGVTFEVFEVATHRPIFMEIGSNLSFDSSKEYVDYYGRKSPRIGFNIGRPSGFISCDGMILSDAEMDRDEFYQDCLQPVGLRYFIAAQVHCSASHQAVVAVQRSPRQGHVGDSEQVMLERLLPHLQQATDLRFRLAAARLESRLGLEGLERLNEGCLILDAAGRTLHLNATARRIVAEGDGAGLRNGQLAFSDSAAARSYGKALGQLAPPAGEQADMSARSFPARRPSGKRPYLVAIRSLPKETELEAFAWGAAAILFIRDPELFVRLNDRLLSRSFGLTRMETKLAVALDRGLTLRDVARKREVSITTVRSQLYSLMAKLAVRRQSDLIRLLANYRQPFA